MRNKKIKGTPLRTCVVCKKLMPKKELIRIVKDKDNSISVDFGGKQNGRGAYICDSKDCIAKCAEKRMLNKSFKSAIPEELYQKILEEYVQKDI